jgi:hypothetical protein
VRCLPFLGDPHLPRGDPGRLAERALDVACDRGREPCARDLRFRRLADRPTMPAAPASVKPSLVLSVR